jgi:hypothetical protein
MSTVSRGLCYAFPLRQDFMVQLILPYDLTEAECARITHMLSALSAPSSQRKAGPLIQGLTVKEVASP